MSASSIIFKITEAGLNAVFNAKYTGLDIDLTHMQLGSGKKIPTGTETALISPKQTQAIGYGSHPANNQISMTVSFPITSTFDVSEVGIWSGEPGKPGAVLFAYYSMDSGNLITTTPGVDFVFTHDLIVDPAVADSINISISPDASAFALHMTEFDPHPQYAKYSDFIFNDDGYYKFPNGLIIQYGQLKIPKNNQNAVEGSLLFPISFPNSIRSIVMNNSAHASEDGFLAIPFSKDISLSGFSIIVDTNATSWITIDQTVYWIAIGN